MIQGWAQIREVGTSDPDQIAAALALYMLYRLVGREGRSQTGHAPVCLQVITASLNGIIT